MIPFIPLTIRSRAAELPNPEAQKQEIIHVVEVPFSVLYECCINGLDDISLAEAAVRRQSTAGVFNRGVPPGWLSSLDDESSAKIIEAATRLNITRPRAKKVAGLMTARHEAFHGPQPSPANEPSSSSSPADTRVPAPIPEAS